MKESENGRIDTERTEPKTEEKEQKREIATAQKSEEVLSKYLEKKRNLKPESVDEPEVVDKPFGTRKQYIDSLTEYGAATYLKDEHRSGSVCFVHHDEREFFGKMVQSYGG